METVKSENFEQSTLTDESFSIFNIHAPSGVRGAALVLGVLGLAWRQGGQPPHWRFSIYPHRMGRTNRELLEIIYVTISWFWVLKHVNVRNPSLPSEESFVYLTSD